MYILYLTLPSLLSMEANCSSSRITMWGVEVLLFLVAAKDFLVALELFSLIVRATGFFSTSFLQFQLVAVFFLLNFNISMFPSGGFISSVHVCLKSFGILLLFLYHHVCMLLVKMVFLVLLSYPSA